MQNPAAVPPARPAINWRYRWQEDWSALADPARRTDPFDAIKYIPLGSGAQSYLSLGVTIRERVDSVTLQLPPLRPDDYWLQRMQLHADLHAGSHLRVFTQLVDARAAGKAPVGPADADRLDLEQGFVDVTFPAVRGSLRIRVGRHEPQLDLQRFADIRDGPNVRQPFDSAGADYTRKDSHLVVFYIRPVLTRDRAVFDDVSSGAFTVGGARLEQRLGAGKLSVFFGQLRNEHALYLAAAGRERRDVLDVRHAGRRAGWDWDVEGMAQGGHVEVKTIRAWGVGGLVGHTAALRHWSPRFGVQFDAASGTRSLNGNTVGTFNPLFPSGFYELLAGYPGYANFAHVKASATLHPAKRLSTLFSGGLLWRETTDDAVYLLPAIPVTGTAGHGGAYSGAYAQIHLDWVLSPHATAALDLEHFSHGASLRPGDARGAHFIALELKLGI